jgi:predicted  nucleic acid-binding Zn-ribbon protein
MTYTGESCFYCGLIFKENDDVVVCPECGTPYHRICYKKENRCINDALHESGESWQRKVVEKPVPSDEKSEENTSSEESEKVFPMFEGMNDGYPFTDFKPEQDMGGATLKEVAEFVDSNRLYYVPLFKNMKETGRKISFNLICLFFPYFYFANRKMWLWAIITAFITVLFNLPTILYVIGEQNFPLMSTATEFLNSNSGIITSLIDICNSADWLMRVLTCLFGNYMYFRFTVNSIAKYRKSHGTPVKTAYLNKSGGVQPLNIIIMLLIMVVMVFLLYFATIFILMLFQNFGIIV